MKNLAIFTLFFVAQSCYAACPATLTGTFSGTSLTQNFQNGNFVSENVNLLRFTFDGKGTASNTSTGKVTGAGYKKSSTKGTADVQDFSGVNVTYGFYKATCSGFIKIASSTPSYHLFYLTNAGNTLSLINKNDTDSDPTKFSVTTTQFWRE